MEINRPLNSLQQVLIDAVLLEAWQLGGWSCFINKMLLASFSGIHTVPSTRVCANLASLGSGGSVGKESACSAGDPGLIPRLGRSAREGIGYPLQYSLGSQIVGHNWATLTFRIFSPTGNTVKMFFWLRITSSICFPKEDFLGQKLCMFVKVLKMMLKMLNLFLKALSQLNSQGFLCFPHFHGQII